MVVEENYETNSFHVSRPHVASLATHTNSGVKVGVTLSHVIYFNLLFLRFSLFSSLSWFMFYAYLTKQNRPEYK